MQPRAFPGADGSHSSAQGRLDYAETATEETIHGREHIKDDAAVYQGLWDRGRTLPKGLVLKSVWFHENVERSYRLMQTDDRRLLDEWMANWNDLIEFEVYPVITPEEAGEKVADLMHSSTSRRSAEPV